MDPLVQCPVCTLFLHNGMTLESHLDTHPKDQVIKALCNLTTKAPSYGSRTTTPLHSERSYRSRSRTPAAEDTRWNGSHRSDDRYWRRTPSRTPKSNSTSSSTRNGASDVRMSDMNFENNCSSVSTSQLSGTPFIMKADKIQQTYQSPPISEFDPQYIYYDQQEDREIKYSRSAEYNSISSPNSMFTYNNMLPTVGPGVKLVPAVNKRGNDLTKILPKPNNILLKNMGGVQYVSPGTKPIHMVVPSASTIVQKNVQNNMIMTGNVPNLQIQMDSKRGAPSVTNNQIHHITSSGFTPGTTVVTQNSQIIYREMVNNVDGKPYISNMPTVVSAHDNVTNLAQTSSLYQNVMVVDQFGNASCVYATPQQIIPKCPTTIYNETLSSRQTPTLPPRQTPTLPHRQTPTLQPRQTTTLPPRQTPTLQPRQTTTLPPRQTPSLPMHENKSSQSVGDPKTLIIEVGPIAPSVSDSMCESASPGRSPANSNSSVEKPEKQITENVDSKSETQGVTKGLKILSNIKVEVPVQHHKNMVNTVMDLTGPNDSEYHVELVPSPEKILPDLDDTDNDNMHVISDDTIHVITDDTIHLISDDSIHPSNSSADSTFAVIKRKSSPKELDKNIDDNKIDTEFSDSCPVPDLICNEKPSISPCSELSENGDNSTDQTSISPKPAISQVSHNKIDNTEKKILLSQKPFRLNPLRLNNIYVKKSKKILQIKNAKTCTPSKSTKTLATVASSSKKAPENFSMNKLHSPDKSENKEKSSVLQTISVEEIKENDDNNEFDADIEEQSMDIEPVAPSSMDEPSQFTATVELQCVHVKEEINTSNEGGFSNHTATSDRELAPMETLRPINVVSYANMSGDFEDDSNDRELLDLETTSKNKQFVNMMNENYFGDNIYADYFTPDRVETFEAEREAAGYKEGTKDGMYNIWGEPSQKENENEFVLPNFIHESYKIAESSGIDYSEMGAEEQGDVEGEPDSKVDVLSEGRSESEAPLNICADERMPPRGELSGQESNGDMESPWGGVKKADMPMKKQISGPKLQTWTHVGNRYEDVDDLLTVNGNSRDHVVRLPQQMYTDVPPTEPYDLIARESWVSDGSDIDVGEKRETLVEEIQFPKSLSRVYTCRSCGMKSTSLKELRAHKALVHGLPALPTCSVTSHVPKRTKHASHTYSRLVTDRKIKKEEKSADAEILSGNLLAIEKKEPITPTIPILQVYDTLEEAKPKIEGLIKIKQEPKRRRKDFVCPTCKVDQGSDKAFNAHLKIHPLECLTCGKCFFRRANMALHMKMHLGIRNYKCEVCEKRFITRQKLKEHHNVHTGRQPIKCTVCDDTFRRYSNMVQHRDRHHLQKRAKVRDFVCPCGAVFHSRAKLLWHKETHDDKPKACHYCSDKFVHASSLTRHVRRTHNAYFLSDRLKAKGENVACPVCKQVCLRANLRAHLSTHSGARPFPCVVCNKSFTTKWNLKLHRWTHMSRSAKPYKCSLCASAFVRHSEFVSHMNAHKCVRPYTCNYCGCQFIRKYNCQRHVREHEMAKKFVCKVPECGKSFHRSYYLSEHMKVHSGARPFSCNICGKTSSNKSNHNKHVKIHHAREPVATEA